MSDFFSASTRLVNVGCYLDRFCACFGKCPKWFQFFAGRFERPVRSPRAPWRITGRLSISALSLIPVVLFFGICLYVAFSFSWDEDLRKLATQCATFAVFEDAVYSNANMVMCVARLDSVASPFLFFPPFASVAVGLASSRQVFPNCLAPSLRLLGFFSSWQEGAQG